MTPSQGVFPADPERARFGSDESVAVFVRDVVPRFESEIPFSVATFWIFAFVVCHLVQLAAVANRYAIRHT